MAGSGQRTEPHWPVRSRKRDGHVAGIELSCSGYGRSSDLAASLRVQAMSVQFAHGTYQDAAGTKQPISQDMLNNFQQAINDSPVLAEQVKAASAARPEPHIKHFAIASAESGLGAATTASAKP